MVQNCFRGLIVDSAIEMADLIKEYLESLGCVVEHTITGVDALDSFREKSYDFLVISNRTMGIDSSELCHRLHQIQPKALPIFIGQKPDKIRCGIQLESPIKLSEMWGQICASLSHQRDDIAEQKVELV